MGGKKRPGIFGALLGITGGIVFLFLSTFFGSITGIDKMTATTNATIVSVGQPVTSSTTSSSSDSSSACSATAKYTVDGKDYTQSSSISSSDMCSLTTGQTVQINYNPENPGQWATNVESVKQMPKIFLGISVVVIITSLFTFIVRLLSIIFGWKLLRNGRALAKTLPEETNLSNTIKEINHEFKTLVFGSGTAQAQPAVSAPQDTPNANNQTPTIN